MVNKNKLGLPLKTRIYELFKKTYQRFLKIRGEPREIALGFALGLLVGMTPAIGFHMLIAIFFATLFKWNKISAALAVWITNPITAPVIYSITYLLGARVLGLRKSYEPTTDEVTSATFIDMLKKTPEMFAAMTIGGFIIGLPLSIIGCYIAYKTLCRYQEDIKKKLTEQKLKHTLKRKLKKEKKKQKALNRDRKVKINQNRKLTMEKNKVESTYHCIKCNRIVKTNDLKKSAPKCCGSEMELGNELPACQSTATAEHARPDEMAEPCDDGRLGKI